MKRLLIGLVAMLGLTAPALAQDKPAVYTSATELVDNTPDTPGIIIVNAKTVPQAPKNKSVYRCNWKRGDLWAYTAVNPCPATDPDAPVVVADPWEIKAPVITAECKPLVSKAGTPMQWTYFSAGGTLNDACITRALDVIPLGLDATLTVPREISNVKADNVRGFLTQQTSSKVSWRPFENIHMNQTEASCSKRCVFIRGGTKNVLIENSRFTGIGINTSPGDIPVGIGIGGGSVTIRNTYVANFKTEIADPKKYDNADCISAERGDFLWIYYVTAENCSDGVLDTKATTVIGSMIAKGAGHYNYRFWAKATADYLESWNPGYAHIQVAAASTDVHIKKLVAHGKGALVKVDKAGGTIIIDECDLRDWYGTVIKSGASVKATFGPTCKVPVR